MRHISVLLSATMLAACASSDTAEQISKLKKSEVVTYYDRNHDGVVDFELHDFPGLADAAWAFSDTKFRGRYNIRLTFGYAFERESVDIPVPKNVKITPGKPKVFTTQKT
jgi:hypothetical protein